MQFRGVCVGGHGMLRDVRTSSTTRKKDDNCNNRRLTCAPAGAALDATNKEENN